MNELIKLQGIESLSDVLQLNETLYSKASLAVQPLMNKFNEVDLSTAQGSELSSLDEELSAMEVKTHKAVDVAKERRMPLTRIFDEVKKKFTTNEAELKKLDTDVTDARRAIATEILARQRKEDERIKAELAEKQKAIDDQSFEDEKLHREQSALINEQIERMIATYNGKQADQLDQFCLTLKGMNLQKFGQTKGIAESYMPLFIKAMGEHITTLVENAPSRKIELIRNAKELAEWDQQQAENRKQQQQREEADALEQLHAKAEQERLQTTFSTMAQPVETPSQAIGVSIKKKYAPINHAGHLAIIKWWTSAVLPSMTMDELQSKLSFMRTAADKALNAGEKIESMGLSIVDDVKTRVKSS